MLWSLNEACQVPMHSRHQNMRKLLNVGYWFCAAQLRFHVLAWRCSMPMCFCGVMARMGLRQCTLHNICSQLPACPACTPTNQTLLHCRSCVNHNFASNAVPVSPIEPENHTMVSVVASSSVSRIVGIRISAPDVGAWKRTWRPSLLLCKSFNGKTSLKTAAILNV